MAGEFTTGFVSGIIIVPYKHHDCDLVSHSSVETMNDPGLDSAIEDVATETDRNRDDENSRPRTDDSGSHVHWASKDREIGQFLQPTRWWFASVEIPLIAVCGVFCLFISVIFLAKVC